MSTSAASKSIGNLWTLSVLHSVGPSFACEIPGMYGGIVSFEVNGASRDEIFRLMDRLELVVKATSPGDVHSMCCIQ
jgi:cystathionine beta-lyase/cystathionine gamma-synthase